jgi:uncharacterized protein (TIGR04255 family)
MPARAPEFKEPPLIETVLAVQFVPLRGLSAAHIGLFWKQLGDEWDRADEVEAVGQILPWDGAPGGALGDAVIVHGRASRLRFLHVSKSRLLQIENGWFVFNWRRPDEAAAYPRFATLLPEFLALLTKWRAFLAERCLGDAVANLWEVTYVNAIAKGAMWQSPRDWSKLLPKMLATPNLGDLGAPTTGGFRWQFELPAGAGILEVSLDHVLGPTEGREALRMTQLARGLMTESSELKERLQVGHDAIVAAFGAMTSEEAQQRWGRTS